MATVAAGDAVVTLDGAGAVAFANEAGAPCSPIARRAGRSTR